MVRLLPCKSGTHLGPVLCFNPTMVRLLPNTSGNPFRLTAGFNPTMVRLLPNYIDKFCATFHQFQSHNGAIAAIIFDVGVGKESLQFQSHNGAIAATTKVGVGARI